MVKSILLDHILFFQKKYFIMILVDVVRAIFTTILCHSLTGEISNKILNKFLDPQNFKKVKFSKMKNPKDDHDHYA